MVSQFEVKKSPGPNKLNFSFLKKLWYLVRESLGIMFDHIHYFASLPHILGLAMEKLISHNQSAFLKERMLVDIVVAFNKVTDFSKRSKKAYVSHFICGF